MLREGHLLHGPPRNLQEGRASHGCIAPGIDNSETASGLRSLCRPALSLTWDQASQVPVGTRTGGRWRFPNCRFRERCNHERPDLLAGFWADHATDDPLECIN